MSESLGSAVLTLTTDDSALDAGLDRGEAKAQSTADKFTRIGGKMRGVGALLSVALTAPLIAFAAESVSAAKESAEAMGQVEAGLKSMGGVAGRTKEQLAELAETQMGRSLYDDDDILRKVTANLLTFGNVAGDAFDRGQQAAIDMAARLDGDLQGAAMMVGKALNDPIAGITALTRVGVSFTDQQKEQIKAMAEAGDRAGAQKLILGELERQFGGAAQAMRDADPAAALKQSFAAFQEEVGGRILPLLPPLLNGLTGIVDAFGALDPSVQTFVLGAVGIGAVAGPLLMIFGSIASGVGAVIPLLSGAAGFLSATGGAGGVAAAGLAPLAPILLPLAGAVAAVWLAWKNWDQVAPILQGVAQQAQTQTAAIDGHLKTLTDGVEALDRRMGLPTKDEALASIARAVVSTWQTVNQYDLAKWAAGVDTAIARSFGNAIGWSQQLAQGVRQWLVSSLGQVFEWVRGRIQAVGDKFKWLWDVVVGHSYIPDMVDEIGRQMKRLDKEMVAPTNAATTAAAKAFRDLASRVSPMLDRLFPDERQFIKFKKDMDDLLAYAKQVGMSDEALFEAQRRRSAEQYDIPSTKERLDEIMKDYPTTIGDAPKVEFPVPTKADTGMPDDVKADWRDNFRQTFHDGLRAAMDGDLIGFFQNWLADGATKAFDKAVDMLFDLLAGMGGSVGGGAGGGIGGGIGSILSGLFAGGFSVGGLIPSGKFGVVGENGPELAIASPRGTMIRPNGDYNRMFNQTQAAPTQRERVDIHVDVSGARGNAEIEEMVQSGVSKGLASYDRIVGARVQDHLDRRS